MVGPPSSAVPGDDRRRVVVPAIALLLALALVAPAIAAGPAGGSTADSSPPSAIDVEDVVDETIPDDGKTEVVVRFEEASIDDGATVETELGEHADETQEPLVDLAAETDGIAVEEAFWLTNAVVLTVDVDRVALDRIAAIEGVERVHENFDVSLPEPPSGAEVNATATGAGTASTDRTWGIDALNAPAVWDDYDARGEGVRVAVLDTGVDADHPDIDLYTEDPADPTYPGGWAAFDETGVRVPDSTPHDADGHGTHVSGTVAGGSASGTAIGVAPDAELLHGLVLSDDGGTFAQVIAGLEWAVERDADVASMSLGTDGKHHAFVDPVRNARDSGTLVVAAIGNEGHGTSNSPANGYDVLSVGAVDRNDEVAGFSGGERIDRSDWADAPESWPDSYAVPTVVAPGTGVVSAVPGGEYRRLPGTSMATPHVTGTIAVLLSVEPAATIEELETAVTNTTRTPAGVAATDVDPETRYGHGVVDAKAAADALVAARGGVDPDAVEEGGDVRSDDSDAIAPLSIGAVVFGVTIGLLTVLLWLALTRER